MSQIRPQILMRYGRQNQPIRVPIENQLIDPTAQTYLSADVTAGAGSLTVQNISNFAINQILLIGDPGNQNSEIIKTHASTAPSGNTITLAANTVFAHSASTPVTTLYFDRVEISTATTTGGSKTVLLAATATPASLIPANQPYFEYNDVAASVGFYFARWNNSIASTFSPYSEPSPVTAYTMQSARSLIDSALGMINKQTSSVLTDEYAFQNIDSCQMEVLREFKRWSFMQAFNTIVGTAYTGNWKIPVPADCDDQNTYKSLYNFRIGKELDMVWVDKEEWDDLIAGIAYSTLTVAATIGQTSLTLANSTDFDDTGTIQVGADQYTWTVNTRSTGVLTLGSALINNYALGQDVFQFASLGLPTYWTIWGGYIYHWPAISSSYNNRNYYLDYYKALTQITSDSDQIVLPDPTVVQYYLAWKFLLKLNNGEETDASKAIYSNYILRREKMKQKESINRNFILNPDIGDNFYGNIYS
jgi:hypothetical protein